MIALFRCVTERDDMEDDDLRLEVLIIDQMFEYKEKFNKKKKIN